MNRSMGQVTVNEVLKLGKGGLSTNHSSFLLMF